MSEVLTPQQLRTEIDKRRTFAIISHPDAGKTTLTERLLLYSGMIRTAGLVRARKGQKAASSDWMGLEQERGISITASAMQFRYKDALINVLDTPGHQDFSEDTYRTLTAADCAIMVIDSTKGVEAQTKKLFAVCRMKQIPVLTFMNKMDLEGRDPFELMEEVEQILGIHSSPLNWPIGQGQNFAGVVDVQTKEARLFRKRASGGAVQAEEVDTTLDKAANTGLCSAESCQKAAEELELLEVAGNVFDRAAFLRGEVTPVFFGSAITNFGVEPFFDTFVRIAPAPYARKAYRDTVEMSIDPYTTPFSAFVFKIQANMNPKHRDSMAFLRVCSGAFERDMVVKHHRLNKDIRLSRPHSLMAGERSTMDAGVAGDIVGAINPGVFAIGDTVSISGGFEFPPMPQFPPEVIAQIRPKDVSKRKAFDKGIKQLGEEGAIQVLRSKDNPLAEPFVAAVGRLQFEVLQYRLREEYGVDTVLELTQHECGAWLVGDPATFQKPSTALLALDARDRIVVLFRTPWEKSYAATQNPSHQLLDYS